MRPANSNDKGALQDVARKSIDTEEGFSVAMVRLRSTSPRNAPAWSRSSKVACSSPDVNVAHGIRIVVWPMSRSVEGIVEAATVKVSEGGSMFPKSGASSSKDNALGRRNRTSSSHWGCVSVPLVATEPCLVVSSPHQQREAWRRLLFYLDTAGAPEIAHL